MQTHGLGGSCRVPPDPTEPESFLMQSPPSPGQLLAPPQGPGAPPQLITTTGHLSRKTPAPPEPPPALRPVGPSPGLSVGHLSFPGPLSSQQPSDSSLFLGPERYHTKVADRLTPLGRFFTMSRDMSATESSPTEHGTRPNLPQSPARRPWAPPSSRCIT